MPEHEDIIENIVDDLLDVIEKYNNLVRVSTIVGILEITKHELINKAKE